MMQLISIFVGRHWKLWPMMNKTPAKRRLYVQIPELSFPKTPVRWMGTWHSSFSMRRRLALRHFLWSYKYCPCSARLWHLTSSLLSAGFLRSDSFQSPSNQPITTSGSRARWRMVNLVSITAFRVEKIMSHNVKCLEVYTFTHRTKWLQSSWHSYSVSLWSYTSGNAWTFVRSMLH